MMDRFVCKDCDVFFTSEKASKEHLKSEKHLRETGQEIKRTAFCDGCDKSFSRKNDVARHKSSGQCRGLLRSGLVIPEKRRGLDEESPSSSSGSSVGGVGDKRTKLSPDGMFDSNLSAVYENSTLDVVRSAMLASIGVCDRRVRNPPDWPCQHQREPRTARVAEYTPEDIYGPPIPVENPTIAYGGETTGLPEIPSHLGTIGNPSILGVRIDGQTYSAVNRAPSQIDLVSEFDGLSVDGDNDSQPLLSRWSIYDDEELSGPVVEGSPLNNEISEECQDAVESCLKSLDFSLEGFSGETQAERDRIDAELFRTFIDFHARTRLSTHLTRSHESLRRNGANNHSNPFTGRWKCPFCEHSCESDENMLLHVRQHVKEDMQDVRREYICPHCDFAFFTVAHLSKHIVSKEQNHCGFSFKHESPCRGCHNWSESGDELVNRDRARFELFYLLIHCHTSSTSADIANIEVKAESWSIGVVRRWSRASKWSFTPSEKSNMTAQTAPLPGRRPSKGRHRIRKFAPKWLQSIEEEPARRVQLHKSLREAVIQGNAEEVRLLLKQNADPNLKVEDMLASPDVLRPPLFYALETNRADLIDLLCAYGANPYAQLVTGESLLQYAVRRSGRAEESLIKHARIVDELHMLFS